MWLLKLPVEPLLVFFLLHERAARRDAAAAAAAADTSARSRAKSISWMRSSGLLSVRLEMDFGSVVDAATSPDG
jgi:hypothetical protein